MRGAALRWQQLCMVAGVQAVCNLTPRYPLASQVVDNLPRYG